MAIKKPDIKKTTKKPVAKKTTKAVKTVTEVKSDIIDAAHVGNDSPTTNTITVGEAIAISRTVNPTPNYSWLPQ